MTPDAFRLRERGAAGVDWVGRPGRHGRVGAKVQKGVYGVTGLFSGNSEFCFIIKLLTIGGMAGKNREIMSTILSVD